MLSASQVDAYMGGALVNTVLVRVEQVYGQETAYPANQNARLFTLMTGCKTLREDDLRRIKALGFEVALEQRVPEILKGLVSDG